MARSVAMKFVTIKFLNSTKIWTNYIFEIQYVKFKSTQDNNSHILRQMGDIPLKYVSMSLECTKHNEINSYFKVQKCRLLIENVIKSLSTSFTEPHKRF